MTSETNNAQYREFIGRYCEQMPQLLESGYTPLTVADVMRQRLEATRSTNQELSAAWLANEFDTSDATLHRPHGRLMVMRDAQPLKTMNTTPFVRAWPMRLMTWRSIAGPEFRIDALVLEKPFARDEVRAYYPLEGTGRYVTLMAAITNDERTPLSVASFMEQRLAAARQGIAWQEYATGDGIAYDSHGMLRLALDARLLRTVTPSTTILANGALPLSSIDTIAGPLFRRSDLACYNNRILTQQEAVDHPVWRALAREDKTLLREYAQLVFSEIKTRWNDDRGMGVYLATQWTTAGLQPCVVTSIDSRSGLTSRTGEVVRLVGVQRTTC